MKLEVGMYVRTKKGTFDRFITSHKNESLTWYTFEDRGNITNPENYIIKASHNIIDLIEPMDLMFIDISPDDCGGIVVPRVAETEAELKKYKKDFASGWFVLKGVVTREQIEDMTCFDNIIFGICYISSIFKCIPS